MLEQPKAAGEMFRILSMASYGILEGKRAALELISSHSKRLVTEQVYVINFEFWGGRDNVAARLCHEYLRPVEILHLLYGLRLKHR